MKYFFAADQSLLWSLCLQGELDQERQQHEAMIAAMREEEKFKVDRMARDLEIKWTENLRQVLFFYFIFNKKWSTLHTNVIANEM